MPTRHVNQRPSLEGIGRTHPVVPIVLSKNNQATNANLPQFLEHELSTSKRQIPYTLCEFYGDYLEYVIQRHLRDYRGKDGPRYYGWNIRDAINRLSKLAFLYAVRGAKVTQGMVMKQMHGVGLEKDFKDVNDIEFRSMGLLVQDGVFGKKPIYRFKEPIILEYLVANYHLLQCLQTVTKKSSPDTRNLVSGILLDSMNKLPATGDAWRITFGLLSSDQQTKVIQGQILSEIIDISKRREGMTSFDVTSLCVEAIYESQNAGELTELLDEFTMNQTINYSNVFTQKARIAYAVQAAGYLVRASPDVYGLHLANFGLNEERVALLADPVNAISDNNLQVLNLSRNSLGAAGMRRLQRFIVKASLLTHLDMSLCELDKASVCILSEFFMCLPLRYLNLSDNYIKDGGMLYMGNNLKYVPTLEVLCIARNELTDKSILPLGNTVAQVLPNLRSIDVSGNHIGTRGLEGLSKAIPALHYIQEVKLAENTAGSQEATRLIQCMWRSRSLKHINININDIPPEGVLAMTKLSFTANHFQVPLADEEVLTDDEDEEDDDDISHDMTLSTDEPITELDTSVLSNKLTTRCKLGDSQNVSLIIESPDKTSTMDLLEGRPDRVRAVNLRRSSTKAGTLPRMKDIRRSWHGMSSNLRESMRSTKEGWESRSSLRATTSNESRDRSPSNLRKDSTQEENSSLQRSNTSLRNSLRKSTGSLRDSMRNTGNSLRGSMRNTRNSLRDLRDGFRKRFGRESNNNNRTPGTTIETAV